MTETVRIAMWSGPRSGSTAMMRAWENRPDTAVIDEPFYGAYLHETGLDHPLRAEVLAEAETDWARAADLCKTAATAPIVFQKHIASHAVAAMPRDWMPACRHAVLIRAPEAVALSFKRGWDGMAVEDLGFARLARLADELSRATGRPPPVVLAEDLLADPEGILRALCSAIGVPFDAGMLSWPPGPRASDGFWGAHWYASVRDSIGFGLPRPASPVPPDLAEVVAACRPDFETLARDRLRATGA